VKAKASSRQSIRQRQGGQIVLEYVLLIVIGVTVAMLITSTMVSRDANSPGFLIRKWFEMIRTIGEDPSDDLKPQE
jgi:uncharacterized protein (UPF0333 family)